MILFLIACASELAEDSALSDLSEYTATDFDCYAVGDGATFRADLPYASHPGDGEGSSWVLYSDTVELDLRALGSDGDWASSLEGTYDDWYLYAVAGQSTSYAIWEGDVTACEITIYTRQ